MFTENILLRLRDNPDQLKIGKIESFLDQDTKETRQSFLLRKQEIFEWCKQKWDEISASIEKWATDELDEKWLVPLFQQFDYELEPYEINSESIEADNPLKNFKLSFQSKDWKNPFFQFVNVKEDFESKITSNPQGKSHHDICQQFVNLNPEIRWLFLSNGKILRILTKYYHTYSKGFIEFDLENIFANRDVVEYNTLFSTIYSNRYTPLARDHEFLIDLFQKESITEGVKIGDTLRDNVHDAIELLGDMLIYQNRAFQDKILGKQIDLQEYYAELLRIIYRIIFILYAEQREMLPGAGSLYFEQFSISAIKMLAEKPIKPEKNCDLWKKLFLTFKLVQDGDQFLGINAYNGSLFNDKNLSIIVLENQLSISNEILLKVVRFLTTSKVNNILQRINFLEISEEEIGAIYESLLDYKPYIDSNLRFQLISGTERKSTGSYYTPKSLIDILIRTTLQQLIQDRLEKAGDGIKDKEKILLDLKVCDPACGGGTFLLAAMDFLGKKLAEVRTGIASPSELDLREARRDILQHCIYGVDMNPLAVELAKISLWLRASVKDKPLNFLDNHIKCGNSLIGLGQKTNITEISPDSFKAILGNKETGISSENSRLCTAAKNIIRTEARQRQTRGRPSLITSYFTEKKSADICSAKFQELIDMSESDTQKINQKERNYKKLRENENYRQALNEANIWTAPFFWRFEGEVLGEIPRITTIEQLKSNLKDPELEKLMNKVSELSDNNQFFHWYIEFPEVFSSIKNGFDCILTNPPWEALQLKENEFFMGLNNEIISASTQSERRKLISKLDETDPRVFNLYKDAWIASKKLSHYLTTAGLFNLSARGTINTYQLFVERCWRLINSNGYAGIICPTGIIMNFHLQDLFKTLVQAKSIMSLFDFENKNQLFNIHRQFRFCLLTLGGQKISQDIIPMTFFAIEPEQIQEPLSIIFEDKKNLKEKVKKLPDDHILIALKQTDFNLFNPNTITCPSFRSKKDFELLRHLYKQTSVLIQLNENGDIISNPWDIKFLRMIDMSNDSELFHTEQQLQDLGARPEDENNKGAIWIDESGNRFYPLYEGKMIWIFDHRYTMPFSGEGMQHNSISVDLEKHQNPHFSTIPLYWIEEDRFKEKVPENYEKKWFLGFRDTTGATNERTFILSIIPRYPAGNTLPIMLSNLNTNLINALIANISTIIFDYITRQKITGNHLNFFIVEQLPIFPPSRYTKKLLDQICARILELTYTSYDLKEFVKDLDYEKDPFIWNPERRALLQAELDAIFALLYKVNKKDLEYILETFLVLKKNELNEFNEFRTKRLILEAYDRFSQQKELFE